MNNNFLFRANVNFSIMNIEIIYMVKLWYIFVKSPMDLKS